MFGRRVTLFRLFGFEVKLDASWLIIAALIVWTLLEYFPSKYKGLSVGESWCMAIAGALGLLASIIAHEFSHSLVARRYGLQINGITLFIFGGVAEMGDEPSSPKIEFLTAIAGPVASILLGLALYLVYLVGGRTLPNTILGVLSYLSWMNLALAAFNLIPAFPLDGGRVLRSALWYRKGDVRGATRTASALGSGFGMLLILFAMWQWFAGNFVGAVWYFLIGLFLRGAAQASYQQLMIRMALEGEPVRRFMNANPVSVPSHISIEELVDDYVYRYHHKMFPVLNASEKLAGCVTTNQVKAYPRDEWNRHSIQEVMQACSPENTVTPDVDAVKALSKMHNSGLSRLMVVEGDRLVGVIALKDLLGLLAAKVDLEGEDFHPYKPAHP